MNPMLRQMAYLLTKKWVDEQALEVRSLEVRAEDVCWFCLSTHPIASFYYEDRRYYFRECPWLCPKQEYFDRTIENFFGMVGKMGSASARFGDEMPLRQAFSEEEIRQFRRYLEEKRTEKGFLRRISRTDRVLEKQGYSIWEKPLPLPDRLLRAMAMADLTENLHEIGAWFLWWTRAAALRHRTVKIARGERCSHFGAVRAVGTGILAQALGLEELVTPVQWCRLNIRDGAGHFGYLSPAAPGSRMKDACIRPEGSLQRALMNLNVLDALVHQPDHGPNNYNVCTENGGYQVCAFDNDHSQTLFPFFGLRRPLSGCAPLVDRHGLVARPCFDRALYQRILELDVPALQAQMKPWLNPLQRLALSARLRCLRRALRRTCRQRPDFLTELWDAQTAALERRGQWGMTYFNKAVSACGSSGQEPLVTVIVPVYRVEPYLRQCVGSILGQTYRNLEVILVDDGSPDRCPEICEEYAARDPRVVVLHQQNRGIGAARNAALARVHGKYLAFADSDDFLAPRLIQTAVSHLEGKLLQAVLFGAWVVDGQGQYLEERFRPFSQYTEKSAARVLDLVLTDQIGSQVWKGVYLSKCWKTVRFPEGRLYEDIPTTYRAYANMTGFVGFLPESLYYYRMNPAGASLAPGSRAKRTWHIFLGFSHQFSYARRHSPRQVWRKALDNTVKMAISVMLLFPFQSKEFRDARAFLRGQWAREIRNPESSWKVRLGTLLLAALPVAAEILKKRKEYDHDQ